ncbi:MAG: class SAM-dependent methyltransferase [Caulobacteraceae bacterium]|nr:class SAM-dependent methyltransferase [Caulobacteraceae bacterium]
MSKLAGLIKQAETLPAPDPVRRMVINALCAKQSRQLKSLPEDSDAAFVQDMARRAIAEHVDAANQQHYELPPRFFELVLGPRRKYSSCFYAAGDDLAAAEERSLNLTCQHAGLEDGQRILELGCGWGSLSLWMAEHYPRAEIVSVSNSSTQRPHIEAAAKARGLSNLSVITADANTFQPTGRFDRVVSVEMFEHMANWQALLERAMGWLRPDGRLFLHVFSHRDAAYRFNEADPDDWIAQYFFTGGFMPSHGLIRRFPHQVRIEAEWRWDGTHYEKTALHWLKNMDDHDGEVRQIMLAVYGNQAELWRRRWRLFFLATAGVFGFDHGREWGVSHWRLAPSPTKSSQNSHRAEQEIA